MVYHNSTGKKGTELKKATRAAATQTSDVATIIKWNAALPKPFNLTARRVWYLYLYKFNRGEIELTSVRRSISNLVKQGFCEYGKVIKLNCPVKKKQGKDFPTSEKTIIYKK